MGFFIALALFFLLLFLSSIWATFIDYSINAIRNQNNKRSFIISNLAENLEEQPIHSEIAQSDLL